MTLDEQQKKETKENKENNQTNNIRSNNFLGPKEDNKTQRDCTAIKQMQHKMKTGRLFKNEREDGTRITTINLAGSQFDFDFMLEHCKDHVLIIQEHWRLKDDIHTWESMAYRKGWQGIWEPAKQTEKNNDGVTGRSG